MFIAEARLHNFRSHRDSRVELGRGICVLAGPNNAGKSNVLAALNFLFGERYPRGEQLDFSDFHVAAKEEGVRATLLGLAARLAGFGNDITPGSDWGGYAEEWQPVDRETGEVIEPWTEAWWTALTEPVQTQGRTWLRPDGLADRMRKASTSGELWAYLVGIRNDSTDLHIGYLLCVGGRWERITRLSGAVRSGLLTTAHLPAFRSPGETLRINDWTWYGKLIRRLYQKGRAGRDADFAKAEGDLSKLIDDAFRDPATRLQQSLQPLVPGLTVRSKAGAYTLDDAHKGVSLFVDDGVDAPFDEKGGGVQALVLVGLIRCYCDEYHQASSVLLLEEPENFLHPHGRRALAANLKQFVSAASDRRQVIVTTHSETFVRLGGVDGLRLIRRSNGASTALRVDPTHGHAGRWRQILSETPECVFADHAILVEGGEVHLVPVIANQILGPGVLDHENVSIVRVEGKENFKKHITLLDQLGVDWTILTDRDILAQGWMQFSDLLPANINQSDQARLASELKQVGVFVNSQGCLEDLYTGRGKNYVTQHGKDRAALLIAREIEEGRPVSDFFENVEPFQEVTQHALARVREVRNRSGAVPTGAE